MKKNIVHYSDHIEQYLKDHTKFRDIYDGEIYKSIQQKLKPGQVPLCFTLNTDGVKVFEDSGYSLWPIQLLQNYLPPNLRYKTIYWWSVYTGVRMMLTSCRI